MLDEGGEGHNKRTQHRESAATRRKLIAEISKRSVERCQQAAGGRQWVSENAVEEKAFRHDVQTSLELWLDTEIPHKVIIFGDLGHRHDGI
jgi:hypothetical protein